MFSDNDFEWKMFFFKRNENPNGFDFASSRRGQEFMFDNAISDTSEDVHLPGSFYEEVIASNGMINAQMSIPPLVEPIAQSGSLVAPAPINQASAPINPASAPINPASAPVAPTHVSGVGLNPSTLPNPALFGGPNVPIPPPSVMPALSDTEPEEKKSDTDINSPRRQLTKRRQGGSNRPVRRLAKLVESEKSKLIDSKTVNDAGARRSTRIKTNKDAKEIAKLQAEAEEENRRIDEEKKKKGRKNTRRRSGASKSKKKSRK